MIVTEQQKARLQAEKVILLEGASPFVCRGFEVFETTAEVALLQEYIDGRALYECVWKYRDTGTFPEGVAKFFVVQLVLALRDLHARGYIHRDFKSGNVLIGKDGFAKVIDFGLSKKVAEGGEGSGASERTQSLCGTPYIMAPEMFFRKPYGYAVDWWSLGVVIYEMVVGHPPWEYQCPTDSTMDEYFQRIKRKAESLFLEDDAKTTNPLSSDLKSLISALLQIDPHKRLGRNGAPEVINHAWFSDIDWPQCERKELSFAVPYDFSGDYNPARVRPCQGQESLSSAESIDPEDNAKYFAGF
ncbi:hypothetical protein V7S43_001584 [Phytophthora oleae]|uniref:non-specific serine/threonine protein kinase n=1 Tax=Phytophthora oleae TaxID=2107226 RepID=A0ABD3G6S9_9STRA